MSENINPMEERENTKMDAEENQQTENRRTDIEKIMMGLPSSQTPTQHKQYLAGFIDCLENVGEITTETHDELYMEYVG